MDRNPNLKAVFWDYPQFQDSRKLNSVLECAKKDNDIRIYQWIITRFLEYGRVKDVAAYFSLKDIQTALSKLHLTEYSYKKWRRLLEVYDPKSGLHLEK